MKVEVADAAVAIVEAMLPRFSPEDRFLHIPVGASVSCYSVDGRDTDVTVHRDIHLLFHRPHNYTKVWVAMDGWFKMYEQPEGQRFGKWVWRQISDDRFYNLNDLDWYMTSNHDSCWRSDGLQSPLFEIYMAMQDALSEEAAKVVGHSVGRLSGPNANWHVSLDPIGGRIGFFTGEIAEDGPRNMVRGVNYDYMKLPKNLEPVKDAARTD